MAGGPRPDGRALLLLATTSVIALAVRQRAPSGPPVRTESTTAVIARTDCAPDNQTMTALNWVWPPLMVALAVWMFARCAAR